MTDWEPTTQPWIVCAAIRRKVDGSIIVGPRHFDETMQAAITGFNGSKEPSIDNPNDRSWADADQGFIDQFGRFYSREGAMNVAMANKQLINGEGARELYSEDLY